MARIHTKRSIAMMTDQHSIWNGADKQFIANSMCFSDFAIKFHMPISGVVCAPCPYPASVRELHVLNEQSTGWFGRACFVRTFPRAVITLIRSSVEGFCALMAGAWYRGWSHIRNLSFLYWLGPGSVCALFRPVCILTQSSYADV
jgi:hypothetical protein